MFNFKKIAASVLTCTMLMSTAACSLFNRVEPEEIINAADIYAKCVTFLDANRLLENTETLDYSESEAFKEKLSMSGLDYDQASVRRAIAETITYEVKQDTVVIDKTYCSCEIMFTRVDYLSAIDGLVGYSSAFLEAISSCDKTNTYNVSVYFSKVDGKWLASADSIRKFADLYSFLDYEYVFGPSTLDLVDEAMWMFSSDGTYTNTNWIELDLMFLENPEVNVYYVVSKDGTDIYTSEPASITENVFIAPFNRDLGAPLTESEDEDAATYIAPGSYNFKIYREDGLLLADETATVKYDGNAEPAVISGGASCQVNDSSFADVVSLGWWDYDGTMASDDVYCINTRTIAFSIEIKNRAPALYYAYYFVPGEDAKASSVNYSTPKFTSTVEATTYPNGRAFYNIDFEPAAMEVGTYVLVIAKDENSIDDPYITAVCSVMSQSSDEIN